MFEYRQDLWYYVPGNPKPQKCVFVGADVSPDGDPTGDIGVDFCRRCNRSVTIVSPADLYTTEHGAYAAMSDYLYDSRLEERLNQLKGSL